MKLNINPNAQRAALWTFIAFAVVLLINYAYKTINKLKAAQTDNQANAVNPGNLSADLKQYQIWADTLEESIGSWNTDESAVYKVFKMQDTTDDVKQLIKAFGKRKFTLLIGDCTLAAYMANGMSSSEIEKINTMLSEKGITIQF